ncbi:extracellular solute-binding protein [Bacillus sp. FJAT-27264]|uniref:extracellular solute-binding protein n=1 Tax=Paenibacillus sp. (strain DSM 101736 / FJAT-27264) TaxID=1850362 RepID=UPI001C30DC9E|nr:extracellular solute-binding protein [Bacillus sp. FJAT-27264]
MGKARLLVTGITVMALMFGATACAGNNNEATGKNSAPETSKPQAENMDPMGKYEPAITVTAVRAISDGMTFSEGESLQNNVWSRAYEKELGIKINYDWTTPTAQYDQKLNIAIASDQLPDIMKVNAAQLKRLVEDEQIEELTSFYSSTASEFTQKILTEDGGNALKSATFQDKLYALPMMGSGLGQADVLWIRADWLKNLGLDVPKTMDDLMSVAKAFTFNDPDQNGKQDTYGLGLNKDIADKDAGAYYAAAEGFFNGYGAYPNIWVDKDGELAYGSIQPEIKTALAALQSMYKDGLLDKEFGTKDPSKVNQDAVAGKVGMLYGYFWNTGAGWLQDSKIADPKADWIAVPLPSATGEPAKAQVPFAINSYYVVKKGAEHPEAAVKLLNLALEKLWGETAEPDVYNTDAEKGTALFNYALLYGEAPRKNLDAYLNVTDALKSKDPSKLNPEEKGYYDSSVKAQGGDNNYFGVLNMYGEKGSLSVLESYSKNNTLQNDLFFGAPTDGMTEHNATLQKQQLETFTQIVMGGDLNQFDRFAENWKALGGSAITKEVNEWNKSR